MGRKTFVVVSLATGLLLWMAFAARRCSIIPDDRDVDVTNDVVAREGIVPGVDLPLPEGLYIRANSSGMELRSLSATISNGERLDPASRAEFEANPGRWPDVLAILEPGATIRVSKIIRHISFEYSCLIVTGDVVNASKTLHDVRWSFPQLGSNAVADPQNSR